MGVITNGNVGGAPDSGAVRPARNRAVLPGGGPWRILENCPAQFHNSLSAYRGSYGRTRCICPRAMARQLEHSRAYPNPNPRKVQKFGLPAVAEVNFRTAPDFSRGACQASPVAQSIAEGGFREDVTKAAVRAREGAVRLCNEECPMVDTCRAWVTKYETVPGSWRGVYGGLDPWARRGQRIVFGPKGAGLVSLEMTDEDAFDLLAKLTPADQEAA